MLDIKRVLKAKPKPHDNVALTPLSTPWADYACGENAHFEHPNPIFEREGYISLNGTWNYAITQAEGSLAPYDTETLLSAVMESDPPRSFDEEILVPFSPEAPLSGVNRQLQPDEVLWYRRSFIAPSLYESDQLVIHFEAVDHVCSCWCNGRLAGTHIGGYAPFAFDLTDLLVPGENQLTICVVDPSEKGVQPRGKQRLDRGDIWYTAQSGIWQSVWLEVVPQTHIQHISVASVHNSSTAFCTLKVHAAQNDTLSIIVTNESGEELNRTFAVVGKGQEEVVLPIDIPDFEPWSPESPTLYYLIARLGIDNVRTYFAYRTVEVKKDEKGKPRFFLNGNPYFLRGLLDQGYWPDGLMTAPTDEALAFDIAAAKELGFNMLRKHIKVESRRWYYLADRMGMLVWQDMINGGTSHNAWHTSYKPTLLQRSWKSFEDRSAKHQEALSAGSEEYRKQWLELCESTVTLLKDHPSIVTWVLFNEGWGQFDAQAATQLVRSLDPTRPIDSVSGWYDQNCGDFISEHNYFRPLDVNLDPDGKRAYVISEFGGLTWSVKDHCSLPTEYGYVTYESAREWKRDLDKLLAKAERLERRGLAGYVYTQLSDVEEETNGLLTYDRSIKA